MGNERPYILRHGSYRCLYDMPLYIDWALTEMCNYNCSYCFGHGKYNKNNFSSLDQLINVVENLKYLNRSEYHIGLSGGEPTIHPNFVELLYIMVSILGKKLESIKIISNGSQNQLLYESLSKLSLKTRINLSISIHTEHVSLDHISELIKSLSDRIDMTFLIMYHPEKREFIEKINKELITLREKYYFDFGLGWLRQAPKFDRLDDRYSKEHKQWKEDQEIKIKSINEKYPKSDVDSDGNKLDNFCDTYLNGMIEHRGPNNPLPRWGGNNRLKDMWCLSGTHSFKICTNGNTHGISCPMDKKYINLFEENAIKNLDFMKMVKCQMEHCGCAANDPIMKFRDQKEAQVFLEQVKIKQKRLIEEK